MDAQNRLKPYYRDVFFTWSRHGWLWGGLRYLVWRENRMWTFLFHLAGEKGRWRRAEGTWKMVFKVGRHERSIYVRKEVGNMMSCPQWLNRAYLVWTSGWSCRKNNLNRTYHCQYITSWAPLYFITPVFNCLHYSPEPDSSAVSGWNNPKGLCPMCC